MIQYDLILMSEECQTEGGVYAVKASSLRLVLTKYES